MKRKTKEDFVIIFGGDNSFELRKIKDNIKTNYCLDNNIKLLRINYLEINKIVDIISALFIH